VIAAVNGVAAGAGCNLALACDVRIAAESATFSQAFVKIGLHPDWGGSWLLPRLIGPSRALEILATGRMVEATEALALGMVDRVTAGERLAVEARDLAMTIAAGPSGAISDIKRAVWASLTNDLESQLALESENQLRAFSSRDGREGVSAFLERRKAAFD
jgi:2-(1,2-epoxy-1,2-dihydrophenyl)acetyl-CoA isomerase